MSLKIRQPKKIFTKNDFPINPDICERCVYETRELNGRYSYCDYVSKTNGIVKPVGQSNFNFCPCFVEKFGDNNNEVVI